MLIRSIFLLSVCSLVWVSEVRAAGAEPENSVIQIINFSQEPDWNAPWRFGPVRKGTGSGFVIEGNRIMTNAHVISWGRQILLRRYQDPRPYMARVSFVGHDCDLALLEVDDPAFFDGLEPLPLGDLPAVRSTVVTYGYPAGGEQISYTRGVVSRIEVQEYVHPGNRALLTAQTDAAINPGNSGGPVIQDGEVVGVAFQGISSLENTGFFIPPTVIGHFLADVKDGAYDGFPQAGIRVSSLQNNAFRRFLGLEINDSIGARIDGILNVPTTRELLRMDDVLLKIGQFPVGSDGTVLFSGNRVHLAAAFHQAQHGDRVPVSLWRDGTEREVELPLFVYTDDRTAGNQHDVLPRYFIHGGLVFTPLSLDYIKAIGRRSVSEANASMLYELYYRRHESPDTVRAEPIVLAAVLAHAVNANFGIKGRVLVNRINGVRIDRLEDVIRAFGATGDGSAQDIVEFMPENPFECLDRAAAREANASILQSYGIAQDRRL